MSVSESRPARERGTSTGQFTRNVLAGVAIAALLYVGYLLRDILLLAVLAVFVAVALSAPVTALQQRLHLPRALAILVAYVGVLAVLVVIGLLIVPPFVTEFEHLLRALPGYVRELENSPLVVRWDRQYGLIDKLQGQVNHLPSLLGDALSELESVTVGVVERIVELIAILAVAFLLLLDAPRLMDFVYRQLLPPERRDQARRVARQSATAIGGYVGGVFAVALLAGVVAFLVMSLLGIPYAVPLAAQMALFAIIPLVGSPIGAVLIAVVAAFEGPGTVAAWIVFWIVYQQAETHIIGPFVYRKAVDLRPVLVILSVLAGATLLGVLGALLAIPAVATIQILVREWWRASGHGEAQEAVAEAVDTGAAGGAGPEGAGPPGPPDPAPA